MITSLQGRDAVRCGTFAIVGLHFLIFIGLGVSLFAVQPSPIEPMGYFSFEQLVPITYWLMLASLVATAILLTEYNSPFALAAIVTVMLAVRLPLLLMFKLPYNPDSYTYMSIINHWHSSGTVDLSVDLRTQFWPLSFLLLFGLRQLGISEMVLWSWGTVVLHVLNAILIYFVMRVFVRKREAKYALLVISAAPTFNLYYYLITAPQLIASSLFLLGLLALFAYEHQATKRRICVLIGLFIILLFTHHLTALIFALYVLITYFEKPIARILNRSKLGVTVQLDSVRKSRDLLFLGAAMLVTWFGYLATVAQAFTQRFLAILVALIYGKTATYSILSQEQYALATYSFNYSSVLVYGLRLIPLAISLLLLFTIWLRITRKTMFSQALSRMRFRAFTLTIFFGVLALLSFLVLQGLFLEVPRLFDLVMLFSSIIIASWFTSRQRRRVLHIAMGIILLAIVATSSSLAIAVQSSELVYYSQERQATLFVSTTYPNSTLYADERLVTFARYFAPNVKVLLFPEELTNILPNEMSPPVLVLISIHSIEYDRYRPVFGNSPTQVVQFVASNGKLVFSESGVSVYYMA